ncbi:MAG: hypothetical protein ACK53L_14825, partial [Pirellulaceae bacterium]
EEASLSGKYGDDHTQEIMRVAMDTIGADNAICEIPERSIILQIDEEGPRATEIQRKNKDAPSKVDEAVQRAEWTSQPTYQTTPKSQNREKKGETEHVITYGGRS